MGEQDTDHEFEFEPTFEELTQGYWPCEIVEKNDGDGKFERGTGSQKYVNMRDPIECFYQTTNSFGSQLHTTNVDCTNDVKPEEFHGAYRGITLKQLRAIWANVNRRCEEEKWIRKFGGKETLLTPMIVNSHDINKYVTTPFNKGTGKSLVENLPSTKGVQKPRFRTSYSWGMPFISIIVCIEQFVEDFSRNSINGHENRGGGMTEDTPLWMFDFALNEEERQSAHRTEGTCNVDPCETVIMKSIEVSDFRTLCIVDESGTTLQRMWPLLEMYYTLMKSGDKNGSWIVYTPHTHVCEDEFTTKHAVGLTAGGATSDYLANQTLERERHFPTELIVNFITFRVQDGTAEKELDRKRILNTFAGQNVSADVVEKGESYDSINNAFRAHFTTPGTLQKALNDDKVKWNDMLKVMSKGDMKHGMKFDFRDGKGWDNLTNEQALDLVRNLPQNIESLEINGAHYGPKFIVELAEWIKKGDNKLNMLVLENTLVGDTCAGHLGQMALKSLGRAFATKGQIDKFEVWGASVEAVRTLVQQESIARSIQQGITSRSIQRDITSCSISMSIFRHLDVLYKRDNPDYAKITFLLAALAETKLPRSLAGAGTGQNTIDWAQALDDDEKALLFSSQAGTFVKNILNEKFTDGYNLFIAMIDLYVKITIVVSVSFFMDSNPMIVQMILSACLSWIVFRETIQIMTSHVKSYLNDSSNIIDVAQICFIIWTINFLYKFQHMAANIELSAGYLPYTNPHLDTTPLIYTIGVAWISLIYQLSDFLKPLSTFVTALIEIAKGLTPFLFTSFLITSMFAHMFRIQYFGEVCPDLGSGPVSNAWNCTSFGYSYRESIAMFLTDGIWAFEDEGFMTQEKGHYLTFVYAFIVGVLLLNIVIADVSNRFTDVQNNAEKAFWLHRLSLVQEIESLSSQLKKRMTCSIWSGRQSSEGHCNDKEESTPLQEPFSRLHSRKSFVRKTSQHLMGDPYVPLQQRFSFLVSPSYQEQQRFQSDKKLRRFTDWWFSTKGQVERPNFTERMHMFYTYSHWDEVIFPGKVFERIFLGLNSKGSKYDTVLREEVKSGKLSVGLVKIAAWLFFFLHILVAIIMFICGLFFGFLWPEPMRKWLFYGDIDSKELSTNVSFQLLKLQQQNRELLEDNKILKGLLGTKSSRKP